LRVRTIFIFKKLLKKEKNLKRKKKLQLKKDFYLKLYSMELNPKNLMRKPRKEEKKLNKISPRSKQKIKSWNLSHKKT
jgi:hypothetical protein